MDVTRNRVGYRLLQFTREKRNNAARPRRLAAAALGALLAAAAVAPSPAEAQTYPSRNIKMVVAFPPGSATDVLARLLADKIAPGLGVNIVIENKGGGGGNIGTDIGSKADPDGYTLVFSASGPLAVNKMLYNNLPYDPETDLEPISLVATLPNVLVVHPKIPVKTVKEFVAYAKAHPGQVNYSSIGNGSSQHLSAVLFEMATGATLKHVPYRAGPQIVTDLASGEVPVAFQNYPTIAALLQAKQIVPLAVTTLKRSKALPNVPTMGEEGLANFECYAWFGLLAPKGTPQPIVERLNKEVVKALGDPALQARLVEIGAEPSPTTPAQFKALIAAEVKKWGGVIKQAGITAN